jgi:hypothetical protein
MPELGPYGSVRGARGNSRPYREKHLLGMSISHFDPIRTSADFSLGLGGRGNRRFTFDVIHRELGVLCLQRLPRAVPSCALRRSRSESRMPEIGSSGLMSADGKRGVGHRPKLLRPSSTLPKMTSTSASIRSAISKCPALPSARRCIRKKSPGLRTRGSMSTSQLPSSGSSAMTMIFGASGGLSY